MGLFGGMNASEAWTISSFATSVSTALNKIRSDHNESIKTINENFKLHRKLIDAKVPVNNNTEELDKLRNLVLKLSRDVQRLKESNNVDNQKEVARD